MRFFECRTFFYISGASDADHIVIRSADTISRRLEEGRREIEQMRDREEREREIEEMRDREERGREERHIDERRSMEERIYENQIGHLHSNGESRRTYR